MHRWIIACIMLAFMAQSALVYGQTDPSYLKGEEWTDEAGAKVTTLYFTLGDKEWPNADPFHMVVIGDSIAWGCGLYQKEKYHYLVADWLQKTLKRPVEVTVLAHTGATLTKPANIDKNKHNFVDPELGSWDPVLLEQAKHIPNPGDADLILVSGGINDVGVDTLIAPMDNSYMINDRCQDVRDSMNILLRVLLNKCDKSVIIVTIVTGYYTVVSKDTPSSSINKFADFIKENDPNWVHKAASSEISDSAEIISNNCEKFYSESTESLSDSKGGAVYSANEYSRAKFGKDRVLFAAVDFPSDRSYGTGTSKSLLWELLDTGNGGKTNDHRYYYRVSLCDRVSCNCDDKIQAIAHPNVEGNQQYYHAIQKILEQKLSDFGPIPASNGQASSAEPEPMVEAKNFGGIVFPNGLDSFADRVISYNPCDGVKEPYNNPNNAIGMPDYGGVKTPTYVSLGNANGVCDCGSLVLEFIDNALVDVPGNDLYVFEIGPAVEATEVFISEDGQNWIDIGRMEGSTTGIDIHGKASPDQEFHFVKLCDYPDGKTGGSPTPGPDIDAVGAIG